MQVIYRAYDGKHFYTEAECKEHEENCPLFTMYNEEGKTHSAGSAEVVHLPDLVGVSAFVDVCEEEGIVHDGIKQFSSPGWYMWDADQGGYLSLPDRAVLALMQARRE